MSKLYALCDYDLLKRYNVSLEAFVASCQKLQVEIIQYRDKSRSLKEKKATLIALRSLWDGFLLINDSLELTLFCDGVHLGQDDLHKIETNEKKAIKILKSAIGSDKIIGLSTHNKEEIEVANELDINYIGLGAYRATSTKDVSNILGEGLDELASYSMHPVAAIGGVQLSDNFENVSYLVLGSALFEVIKKKVN